MIKSASSDTAAAVALNAITRADAVCAADDGLAKTESPLIRLRATPDEIEEMLEGIVGMLIVYRDRTLESSGEDIDVVVESLALGSASFAEYMLYQETDFEFQIQALRRTLVLRDEGRRIIDDECEAETEKEAIVFVAANDEGISLANSLILNVATALFAAPAAASGWSS
jgi:hypothetical protein